MSRKFHVIRHVVPKASVSYHHGEICFSAPTGRKVPLNSKRSYELLNRKRATVLRGLEKLTADFGLDGINASKSFLRTRPAPSETFIRSFQDFKRYSFH